MGLKIILSGPRALLFLLLAGLAAAPPAPAEWRQAEQPWEWRFPRDHGAHPEFRTEWWYFTGNLEDGAGHRYGYQLTFFRQGLRREPLRPDNPWSIRDVHLAHFAVTEATPGRFRYAERLSRAGPGLAGAAVGHMEVWNLDWSARFQDGTIRIAARRPDLELELSLTPRKPVVLHGDDGLSRKGPNPGQASYYASFTDLASRGTLRLAPAAEPLPVTGTSWFDQEFGSNQLADDQEGWDWFSLHLSDGRDLMVYFLRRQDGEVEPASSGTLVEADGGWRHLPREAIRLRVTDTWTSPHSGAQYPSAWELAVPGADLVLEVAPLVADQELITEGSTGVVYWEGAVAGSGHSRARPVTCEGYVELTGYAGALGGLF